MVERTSSWFSRLPAVGVAAFGVALAWLVYGVVMFAVDRY